MRRRSWIPYATIAVLAAGLYLHTVAFDFVFDDLFLMALDDLGEIVERAVSDFGQQFSFIIHRDSA